MTHEPDVSLIICTRRNRRALQQTLNAVAGLGTSFCHEAELVIVDNDPTDSKPPPEIPGRLGSFRTRWVTEHRAGLVHARHAGLRAAGGRIIAFTDDDVRPDSDWLEALTAPLRNGRLDAVSGHVTLAPHLERDWMQPLHRSWLAAPQNGDSGPPELIGVSMAFRRQVLEKVPGFDGVLGAGALGFGEDSLFSWQLTEAGFRLGCERCARLTHHPDPARLLEGAWVKAARARGRTQAYLRHHWLHEDVPQPWVREWWWRCKLRLRDRNPRPEREGCPCWKISYWAQIEMCQAFRRERLRPRRYERRGLRLRGAEPESGGAAAPRQASEPTGRLQR